MTIPAPQLLALITALVIVVVVGETVRRRQLRGRFGIIWLGVALVVAVAAIFDDALEWATRLVGLKLPLNLVLFAGLIFLLVVAIQLSYEIGRLEEQSRVLAEQVALLRAKVDGPWAESNGAPFLDDRTDREDRDGGAGDREPSGPAGPEHAPVEREGHVQ